MPEGHTLFRLAREQSELFAGRPVHVTSPQGRFAAGAARLDGRVVEEVTSYGKHLFADFGGDVLHVHLGLYGTYTTGVGDPPAPRGALRMRWIGHQIHAEADLGGVGAAGLGGRAGGTALHLGQRVGEGDSSRLVADRVDVRDVVRGDVQHRLVHLQSADRGVHASKHGGFSLLLLVAIA